MDVLYIIAEVCIGLAGFGGVILVLAKGPGEWNPADALRIRFLLVAAFSGLFSSLVPLGASRGGVDEPTSIRCGSGVLLIFLGYWILSGRRQLIRLDPQDRLVFHPGVAIILVVSMMAALLGQLAVVVALTTPEVSRLIFFAGLLCPMAYSAFTFVRVIFVRPGAR